MGSNGEQAFFTGIRDYSAPCLGGDGVWSSAGAVAVRDSLRMGSHNAVMDLLNEMETEHAADTLRDAGFVVPANIEAEGHLAVLKSVEFDLREAVENRQDGFGLASTRRENALLASSQSHFFAAKVNAPMMLKGEFIGDYDAAKAIQRAMRADTIAVDLLGDAQPGHRSSLVLVASQALQKGLQGFGFEGIPGKYQIPLAMEQVQALHRDAAQAVAEESARTALGAWVAGDKVGELSEWVPDSVQRQLYGSLSLHGATTVVDAIEGGMIGAHAAGIGGHEFGRLLLEQGFDINAKTVDQQADALGLTLIEPERQKGQYVGPIVGLDHRAALIKFSRSNAIELPFDALADGQARPALGELVRMGFRKGEVAVSVADRAGREGVGR